MNKIVFLLTTLLVISCESPQPKPNFLFIVVDDLGYKDLSSTGSTFYETPNIDRIAEGGTIFTQGHANASVCSPSRASLLTGVYPTVHGITDWIGAKYGTDWRKVGRKNLRAYSGWQMLSNHLLRAGPRVA